jgi:two-component system sensor histidine kinase FlrB
MTSKPATDHATGTMPGASAAALAQAFAAFSETASQLEDSWQALDRESVRLRRELREARRNHAAQSRHHADLVRRLSALLEALPAGVLLVGADGIVQQANSAAALLLGEPVTGVSWSALRERALAAGSNGDADLCLRDGRRVQLSQKPLEPGSGRALLLTDVTEKRKIEDLLSRHRRLASLGEMAAALAHQIRTPLTAGLLYATNASRRELPQQQRDDLLARSISCLHDLERLISDMLRFARGAAASEQRFALDELLDSVETALGGILQPGQAVQVTRPASGVFLAGNRETLAGALLNLATNALQAAGPSAAVRIIAHASSLQAEISIVDNGPGIDEDLARRIFDPFFTSRPDGTGLGLSVARSIARAHQGEVALLSGTPGATTFVLRLPVAGREPSAGEEQRNVA